MPTQTLETTQKVCKTLAKAHDKAIHPDNVSVNESMPHYPTVGLILKGSLTEFVVGKEVLVHVPVWDFERDSEMEHWKIDSVTWQSVLRP